MKDNINTIFINCLQNILQIKTIKSGNEFDRFIREKFLQYFCKTEVISAEKWKLSFSECRKLSLKNNFNFTNIQSVNKNNILLVSQPNGSQKWPDFLLIYHNIGFPIEFKSSKIDGTIQWNCSIPAERGLYIYNCYSLPKITLFFGDQVIKEKDRIFLLQQTSFAKKLCKKSPSGDWVYYVRNMYVPCKKLLKNDQERILREEEAINFIGKLPWDLSQKTQF